MTGNQGFFPAVMLTFPVTVGAVGLGRRLVHEALSYWELDAEVIYDAKVIMSEFLTNAVKASSEVDWADARPGGLNLVAPQVRVAGTALFLEVWDAIPTLPTQIIVDDSAEGGRGLSQVVEKLSERWGVSPAECGGKVLYAMLRLKEPPPVSITGHVVPLPRDVTRWSLQGTDGQHLMATTALLARLLGLLAKR